MLRLPDGTNRKQIAMAAEIKYKKYKCRDCGYEKEIDTNHYGPCWSFGRINTCPNCPPWKKYPEYGGTTLWDCMEVEPSN